MSEVMFPKGFKLEFRRDDAEVRNMEGHMIKHVSFFIKVPRHLPSASQICSFGVDHLAQSN